MKEERERAWIHKCLQAQKEDFSPRVLNKEDIADFTNDFLLDLRSLFEHFVSIFNDLKRSAWDDAQNTGFEQATREKLKGSLVIYDLADTKGFMLFRKGYRLVFSYVRPGCVKIHFFKQKPFGEAENFVETFLNAITDDTMSINWVHENRKGFVDINILARYYMKRFLQEM